MGVVISEVLDISGDEIEPPPTLGADLDAQFILGMAKSKRTVKMLLNVNAVVFAEEMTAIAATIMKNLSQ